MKLRWVLNLALLGSSLVLTLGVLEVVARLKKQRPTEPIAVQYTEFDPLLGWRHRVGASVRFPQGDYLINSRGLRDRERTLEPAPGTRRLLVLGDSFAEGFSVAFEDSVSQVLERSLTRTDCPTEVVNAGTVGYSNDQELLFFREEGHRYRPQVVLLFFYYNDIVYNARASVGRAPKPLLKFRAGSFAVTNAPLSPPAAPEHNQRSAWRSEGLEWLRGRLRERAPRAYGALAWIGLWPPIEKPRAGSELEVYSRTPSREVQDAWEQTVNILRALRDLVEARGGRLLVVYVPSKMEVSDRDWSLTRARYRVDDTTWDRGRVARRLTEVGRASGFAVLDPTEALRRQDRAGYPPYHAGGGHWNAVGHAVAALEVERVLAAGDWLPACGAGRP